MIRPFTWSKDFRKVANVVTESATIVKVANVKKEFLMIIERIGEVAPSLNRIEENPRLPLSIFIKLFGDELLKKMYIYYKIFK